MPLMSTEVTFSNLPIHYCYTSKSILLDTKVLEIPNHLNELTISIFVTHIHKCSYKDTHKFIIIFF